MEQYHIYYHMFLANNWHAIARSQLELIKTSGLLKNSKIKVGVLYEADSKEQYTLLKELLDSYENIELLYYEQNVNVAESKTLERLKDFADAAEENIKVLYLHTKGVTQYGSIREKPVENWRKMMEYFLIEKWQDCVKILEQSYDCCGINYQDHAGNVQGKLQLIKIFNGNFFWTTTNYVKTLDKAHLFEHRYSAENWLLNAQHNAYTFYNTPISVDLYYEIHKDYK